MAHQQEQVHQMVHRLIPQQVQFQRGLREVPLQQLHLQQKKLPQQKHLQWWLRQYPSQHQLPLNH